MSALNNTFSEINEAISGVTDFFEFNTNYLSSQGLFHLDYLNNRLGVNNNAPSEALDVIGNAKLDGYINQTVLDPSDPSTSNFPNNGDWGFYKDSNFDRLYLCYNNTGELIFNKFTNNSFDKLTNTFSEIDEVLIGAYSLTPSWPEIDSVLDGINNWTVPLATYDSEMSQLVGLNSSYAEIDYAASGIAALAVDFDQIDSGIGFTLDLNYDSSSVNSLLALAEVSLQDGDNVSRLNNDAGYLTAGTSLQSGDNVSTLVNDSLYTSSGDNVSLFANDVGYITGDYQLLSEKGVAGGYASLDAGGKIPSSELPSYVDDVIEYADLPSLLLITGETGKIYVTIDNGLIYRWSGSTFIEISSDSGYPVWSVNTLVGDVVLDPDDLDDSLTTNKFTTQTEIDKLSAIAPNAEVNVNADWTSVAGDSEILNKPVFGDITGSNIADFATSGQGVLADSALQSGDNISLLVNDTGYLLSGDNISVLNNNSLYVASGDNISNLTNDAGYLTSAPTETLAETSSASTDAAKSLYTMSAGIPVEFESSDNNTLFYLDETNEHVGIGTSTPDAKLDVVGDIKIVNGTQGANKILTSDANGLASWQTPEAAGSNIAYTGVAVDYTGLADDYVVDATSADITISLPTAVGVVGKSYIVKNSSAGVITINPSGVETIDGETSIDINSKTALTLLSTNSNWIII